MNENEKNSGYPELLAEKKGVETTIYDKWYKKKEDLGKAFFYHNPRYEEAFIRALINKYKMSCGSTIIDIGCGNGLYSNIFNKYGMSVTGIDISENAISYCKIKYGESIDFICADVFSMEYFEYFDYAFCNFFTFFNMFDVPHDGVEYIHKIMQYINKGGLLFFIWISDLTAVRLPENRFSIMNFTIKQIETFFSKYQVNTYTIDSRGKLAYCLGKHCLNKYVTRLNCAFVKLFSSSWNRVRIVSIVTE